jgi:protein-tyrosine phosphatase
VSTERVLVICTGNLCRSPVAAAMLAGHTNRGSRSVEVFSAGTAVGPFPVPAALVSAVRERGIDLRAHRAGQVQRDDLAVVDLVLGAERAHVRELALLDPSAWPRIFTLKELVRRGGVVGPRGPGEPLAEWLSRAAEDPTTRDLQGSSGVDDVVDPFGGPDVGYVQMIMELDGVVRQLADLVWPSGS